MSGVANEPLALVPASVAHEIPEAKPNTTMIPAEVIEHPTRRGRNALFRRPAAPVRKRPPQRNAAARRRNASLPGARVVRGVGTDARRRAENTGAEKTGAERLGDIGYTVAASSVVSVGGALAARWGFHPMLLSGSLGGVGSLLAWRAKSDLYRQIFTGIAATGISQLSLMLLSKATEPPKHTPPTTPAPAHPSPPIVPQRPKNADLGTLPPGVLDAAFERARAELAIQHDAHAEHEYHHGPIPFVP